MPSDAMPKLPPWATEVQGFCLIGIGVYLKWRGFLGSDAAELKGLRTAIFTLMLPALLLRSTWSQHFDMEMAELILWSVTIHILWVAVSYRAVLELEKRGCLTRPPARGWYLLCVSATSLSFPYALMDHPDYGERAIPAAVLYDLGGNTWVCQLVFAFLGSLGVDIYQSPAPSASARSRACSAESPGATGSSLRAPSIELTSLGAQTKRLSPCSDDLRPSASRRSSGMLMSEQERVHVSFASAGARRSSAGTAAGLEARSFPGNQDTKRSSLADASVPEGLELGVAAEPEASVRDVCDGIGQILLNQVLLNPIMAAFILGTTLNIAGVDMPDMLENWCSKLNTSFGCMIYFLIGVCIDLQAPSREQLSTVLTALLLRSAMQALMFSAFPCLLMRLPIPLLQPNGLSLELRRSFMMCIFSPCSNMVMFWGLQYGHPQELCALFVTISNLTSLVVLTGVAAVFT